MRGHTTEISRVLEVLRVKCLFTRVSLLSHFLLGLDCLAFLDSSVRLCVLSEHFQFTRALLLPLQ